MNANVQKVLQLIRDHIIKNNLGIRETFNLPEMNVDIYLEIYEFKAMLKKICGIKATYDQIETCTEFVFKGTLKLEEDKKKQDALAKVMDKSYKEKHHEHLINFKYFEQMIRKILKKVGYKQTMKKRERDEEIKIEFSMKKENIGTNVSHDLTNFIKLFLQYNDSLDDTSELELVFFPYFSMILTNLKENISKGAVGNETDEALLQYFKNLLTYIGRPVSYL